MIYVVGLLCFAVVLMIYTIIRRDIDFSNKLAYLESHDEDRLKSIIYVRRDIDSIREQIYRHNAQIETLLDHLGVEIWRNDRGETKVVNRLIGTDDGEVENSDFFVV